MFARGLSAILILSFSALSAAAADLDLPPLTTAEPPGFNPRWEGFTFGAFATGNFAPDNTASQFLWPTPSVPFLAPWMAFDAPNTFSLPSDGFGGGLQAGFNKQIGNFVVGGIVDYGILAGSKSSKSFSGTVTSNYAAWPTAPYSSTFSQSLNSFGTIRAKIGYTPFEDWLVYGTGGLAFGETNVSNTLDLPDSSNMSGSRNALTIGYAVGAGVEYAMTPQFSIGLEGLKYDLGSADGVSVANFYTYATIGGAVYTLPESEQIVNKTDFSGFQLRLTATYTFDGGQDQPTIDGSSDANSEVPITVGVRAGASIGRSQMTLFDTTGSTRLSRLTYSNTSTLTSEPYFTFQMPDWDMYVAGYAGLGRQNGGNLQDEDFPPGIVPYSSTNSAMADGSLTYGVIDVGYNALTSDWYRLGVFAGFTFQNDNYNAFGCTQTATNPDVCYGDSAASGIYSNNLTISDEFDWRAARLGISGSAKLPYGLSVSGSAAWLPYIDFNETNYHWLRMPGDFTGPLPGVGNGSYGFQVEGMVDYRVLPHLDIGAGVRYWAMAATGQINFQDVVYGGGGEAQVAKFSSQRAQAFIQTGYHF